MTDRRQREFSKARPIKQLEVHTRQETAEYLGISVPAVRQFEMSAFRKLRRALNPFYEAL